MAEITASVNFKLNVTLWQAIKIRISGVFKNAESFEQQGQYIVIKYKK